jgi:DNA-binding transcriptional regulator YhcF (GntR family)
MRRDVIRDDLRQLVAGGLHLGRLRPGDRLESARGIGRESGADYRVVVAALHGLEREGLVEIHPRGGVYAGCKPDRVRSGSLAGFGHRLVDLAVDQLAAGDSIAAIGERLRRCLDTRGLRVACIECNDDQLDFLAEELRTGFSLESTAVEIGRPHGEPPLAVRQADLLLSTTFHAGEVRRWAARLGKPCVIATLDPRRRADVMRQLAERPVCLLGTDPRWTAKARRMWAGEPGAERLQIVTVGEVILETIPEEAALLLMPRARRLLAGSPLLARALPHRGFSRETERKIVAFVVQANLAAAAAIAGRPH